MRRSLVLAALAAVSCGAPSKGSTPPAARAEKGSKAWCGQYPTETMRLTLATNPHSPPQFRVQGPLTTNPEFARAFSCPVGSKMNPRQRCEVW